MHTLVWGSANLDGCYTRPILLDDKFVCDIDMEEYLDATIYDSGHGYNNCDKLNIVLADAIRIISGMMERRVTALEIRKCLQNGSISGFTTKVFNF